VIRLVCVGLSLLAALAALYLQLAFVGLSASADPDSFVASFALHIIAFIGGPLLVATALVCLLGGVRWAVVVTGWMLVFQLLLSGLALLTVCEPAEPGSSWSGYMPILDRRPDAAGILLGALAVILSVVLVKARRWS
jgi:hypothetical protein